ncbi:hypothetical protein BCR35DRAFT_310959 [Leucosporidium creatinivorum]|uniref:Uncharacterized protein n=1 Tax=Leucosporidium creatinivorum TaxID=106004 RepID=A0A1Y2CJN4_9BASI|nr:hypothetical protein BCR35DRAFT_310959 [Leucosporidium creatinivorum]
MDQRSDSAPLQPSQPAPAQPQPALEYEPPRLPVEIIQMIFAELGLTLKQPTPTSWRTNNGRDSHFERTFRALTFLRPLHSLARAILFQAAHIGSEDRAQAFAIALEQSFLHPAYTNDEGARQPAWRERGYLKQLVQTIRVDVIERKNSKNPGGKGVSPQAIKKLAGALPELATLDISCSDKGGWLDAEMIQALRQWSRVKSMEIQGTGYLNAASIFAELEGLEDLKLRALAHGFTDVFTSTSANARFRAIPRPPNPVLFGAHLKTLVLIRVALDPASTLTELFASSGLNPAILEHLVVSKVVGPPPVPVPGCPSFAIPPDVLQTALQPFMANLRTFHLDLFDVPPTTMRGAREALAQQGLYKNGQLVIPDSNHRPATFLAPHFGAKLEQLTLGGPQNLHGSTFFDQLCNSPARIKELTLVQCAQNPSKTTITGITVDEFVAALDTEWATALEKIDITAMEHSLYDDEHEEIEAWNWEAVVKIEAKLRELEQARRRGGGANDSRIVLVHSSIKPKAEASRSSNSSNGGKRGRDDEQEGGKKKKKSSKK